MENRLEVTAAPQAGEALSGEMVREECGERADLETKENRAGTSPAEFSSADISREEVEALNRLYPAFDLAAELENTDFRDLVSGTARPTLRQVYELCHLDDLRNEAVQRAVAEAVPRAVEEAVATAVAEAVSKTEYRMTEHIRARGQRPPENGASASCGVRMHPAVERLSRADRAMLAKRAERGETIQL